MTAIRFGTDGWRAVIAEAFTFANVQRVAQATADYWKTHSVKGTHKVVVVGFDRRFLSDRFAACVSEVLTGNGFKVVLTDRPTPTPAVSQAVKDLKAVGGVMITASHNPPAFNGFKVKAWFGGPADPAICRAIEGKLDGARVKRIDFADARRKRLVSIKDVRPAHYRAIKRLVDFPLIASSGLRFAHEALFGVGAGCFDDLLANTSCRVTTFNAEHDPNFGGINPEPVERNYTESRRRLARDPHDICLVTDGDADRIGGMDGRGGYVSTHQLICLLLKHFVVHRHATGRVVKALTTTSMVDRMCEHYGLELVETGVGFKYIAAEMRRGDVLLGFEESGGIGFPGHIPERDGILAGMMLLELLATERKSLRRLLAELSQQFGRHEYGRVDTTFPVEKRGTLMEYCEQNPPAKLLGSKLKQMMAYDGVKYVAENGSWLMLRGSGTEPILRIYAEAPSPSHVRQLLNLGLRMTRCV